MYQYYFLLLYYSFVLYVPKIPLEVFVQNPGFTVNFNIQSTSFANVKKSLFGGVSALNARIGFEPHERIYSNVFNDLT